MSQGQTTPSSQPVVLAQLFLQPLATETKDFETLSIVEEIRMDVWDDIAAVEGLTVAAANNDTRAAGAILILGEIVHEAVAQKDLLLACLRAGVAAINALSQRGHVKKIEMTLDGDTISIEDANAITVERLLDIYEARHPGKTPQISPRSPVQVTGTISQADA